MSAGKKVSIAIIYVQHKQSRASQLYYSHNHYSGGGGGSLLFPLSPSKILLSFPNPMRDYKKSFPVTVPVECLLSRPFPVLYFMGVVFRQYNYLD